MTRISLILRNEIIWNFIRNSVQLSFYIVFGISAHSESPNSNDSDAHTVTLFPNKLHMRNGNSAEKADTQEGINSQNF